MQEGGAARDEVDRLKGMLEANIRPSLRPDVSNDAKGRTRYTAYDEKHLKRFRHKDLDGRRWTDDNLDSKAEATSTRAAGS